MGIHKRHPKFDYLLNKLAAQFPPALAAINGAIWEIERQPHLGHLLDEIDTREARLLLPPSYSIEVLLLYCVNARGDSHFLTLLPGDGCDFDLSLPPP